VKTAVTQNQIGGRVDSVMLFPHFAAGVSFLLLSTML
jgi:hypothetical protein